MEWASYIKQMDRALREGQGGSIRKDLVSLVEKGVPRNHAALVANIAWRSGHPELGIRVLHPWVRPSERITRESTEEEKSEYGVCLIKFGAGDEGLSLLRQVDSARAPASLLYQAFGLVAKWDYEGSIPLIRAYLRSKNLNNYQKLVGEVNLAAAFVLGGHKQKAEYLLRDLTYRLSLSRYHLLLGRALHLSAENFIAIKKWEKAEECFFRAEKLLETSEGIDLFIVRKGRAISNFLQHPKNSATLLGLRAIRAEAEERRHWESIRDCDRIEALGTQNYELWNRVYFGTPLEAFRARMRKEAPNIPIEEEYFWKMNGRNETGPVMDLETGKIKGLAAELKAGQALHVLLRILATDFYRPFRIASLHAKLHPQEFYDPVNSPIRARQAIKRLRKWFAQVRLPLIVQESEGSYQLGAKRPCALKISAHSTTHSRHAVLVNTLREKFFDGPFSSMDACREWKLSNRSALRILDACVQAGYLVRSGKTKKTTYRFAPTASKAS